jgi:hypothetical protein
MSKQKLIVLAVHSLTFTGNDFTKSCIAFRSDEHIDYSCWKVHAKPCPIKVLVIGKPIYPRASIIKLFTAVSNLVPQ